MAWTSLFNNDQASVGANSQQSPWQQPMGLDNMFQASGTNTWNVPMASQQQQDSLLSSGNYGLNESGVVSAPWGVNNDNQAQLPGIMRAVDQGGALKQPSAPGDIFTRLNSLHSADPYSYLSSLSPDQQFLGQASLASKNTGGGNWQQLQQEMMNAGFGAGNQAMGQSGLVERMSQDLARYGVNSLADIASYKVPVPGGKGMMDLFYNKNTGQLLPTQYGSSMGGKGGNTFYLRTDANGQVVPTATWKDTGENGKMDLMMLAAMAAMGGGAALGAYGGAAEASTGEAGALGGGGTGGGFGGGAAAEGASATGLASLPSAGTWAQTAIPTLGSTAGEWSVPESLVGMLGDTGASATLGAGLSNANSLGDSLGTFGTSQGGGASNSLFDTLSSAYKNSPNLPTGLGSGSNNNQQQGNGNMLSNIPVNNVLGFLGSLYSANDHSLSDQLTNIANKALERGDPFGDQRQYYEGLLKNTYTDPAGTYGQYKSQDQTFFNKLAAQNAARGRSTDAYKEGVEREAAYNNWLTGYRGQLGGFAGSNIDPSRMAGEYMTGLSNIALMNNYNQQAPWRAGANLFNNPNGSSMSLGDLYNTGKDIYGVGKDIWNWGSSLF